MLALRQVTPLVGTAADQALRHWSRSKGLIKQVRRPRIDQATTSSSTPAPPCVSSCWRAPVSHGLPVRTRTANECARSCRIADVWKLLLGRESGFVSWPEPDAENHHPSRRTPPDSMSAPLVFWLFWGGQMGSYVVGFGDA